MKKSIRRIQKQKHKTTSQLFSVFCVAASERSNPQNVNTLFAARALRSDLFILTAPVNQLQWEANAQEFRASFSSGVILIAF